MLMLFLREKLMAKVPIIILVVMYIYNLVGGIPSPLKKMSSSVGMMLFPIYGKLKAMFQTTNQSSY
jgi:hypothetical protein